MTATWLMAAAIAVALVSHVLYALQHRRSAHIVAVLACLCCAGAIAVSVEWITDQRSDWIAWRFVRGDPQSPVPMVENQYRETMRLSLFVAGALLSVGTLLRHWLSPQLRWRVGLTMVSLAIAAFVGWTVNGADDLGAFFSIDSRLNRIFWANTIASIGLILATAFVWWTPIMRAGTHRGLTTIAAFSILSLGIAARVATLPISYDGVTVRQGPLKARAALWIGAYEPFTDVSVLEPHVRTAAEQGIRRVELAVRSYTVHETASLGPIYDQRSCVVRGSLAEVRGAATYGAMITRAGGRLIEPRD